MIEVLKKSVKHIVALLIFIVLTFIYFSPAVFDGKVLQQGDLIKAYGMGGSQMAKYAEDAKPGEFSAWSDAMFGGMPYVAGYGNPAPDLPTYLIIDRSLKSVGYTNAAMVFVGLICFYILMCVMGVNWWLAIAGAIGFAFASYNIIIIVAGHIIKAYVIAYMPLTLAGMVLLFKRSYIWGAILFLLGVAFSIANSHIQITYYLVFLCLFIYLGFLFQWLRGKKYKEWIVSSLIMVVCVVLAVLPNAKGLYSNWDLSKSSTRGKTELTPKPDATGQVEKVSSGLNKDYAFQWSYGKAELLTLMIPNAYGGESGGTLDSNSELYKELKRNGAQVGKDVQTYTYWGDKSFTSGPVYFGALICFLFIFGMVVIKKPMKWWLFAGSLFLTFLALGRNMDWFNDWMFHYLPMYNKFRTVEMALVIPGLVFPILAFWGLKEMFDGNVDEKLMKKGLITALAITGGLSLIVWLMPSVFLSFQSDYDNQFSSQMPEWYYNALLMDRASLAKSDALRSLIFILLGAALLFWYMKTKNKKTAATVISVAMAVLVLVDLWAVDKRYLNEKNFVKEKPQETYKLSVADQEIQKDKSPSYRVLGLNNPWQDTNVSYFHKSIGGYHAVKLRRYQELIDYRLDGEYRRIVETMQKAKSLDEIMAVLAVSPSLNMLNTRYIIYNPGQPPLVNPYADGNAWFVKQADIVENADAEIAALNTINPLNTAVVDKRFAADLKGFVSQPDSTATIQMTNYRPNHLTYSSKAATEQIAVFSEIYYQPGWTATIDGQPATHFRADWILRAMRVPAGEHTIEFDFRPQGYVTALYISSYSSFFILLLLIAAVGYSAWKEWKGIRTKEEVTVK